jgi:hypothetical protein
MQHFLKEQVLDGVRQVTNREWGRSLESKESSAIGHIHPGRCEGTPRKLAKQRSMDATVKDGSRAQKAAHLPIVERHIRHVADRHFDVAVLRVHAGAILCVNMAEGSEKRFRIAGATTKKNTASVPWSVRVCERKQVEQRRHNTERHGTRRRYAEEKHPQSDKAERSRRREAPLCRDRRTAALQMRTQQENTHQRPSKQREQHQVVNGTAGKQR